MPVFDPLIRDIAAASDLEAAVATLLRGLADRIKATSNDQNIQRLARDLQGARPEFVAAVAAAARLKA